MPFQVFDSISKDTWAEEAKKLTNFLDDLVKKVDNLTIVEDMSKDLGRDYVKYKERGFRTEYLVNFSEAITAECMYLDVGQHSISENTLAWSSLVNIVVSNIREGYYDQLKLERRRNSRLLSMGKIPSLSSSSSFDSGNSTCDDPATTPAAPPATETVAVRKASSNASSGVVVSSTKRNSLPLPHAGLLHSHIAACARESYSQQALRAGVLDESELEEPVAPVNGRRLSQQQIQPITQKMVESHAPSKPNSQHVLSHGGRNFAFAGSKAGRGQFRRSSTIADCELPM